jgi:hypothetical protein
MELVEGQRLYSETSTEVTLEPFHSHSPKMIVVARKE